MAKEAMLTRKVLITSGKGGVGKSCCTVFLGQALAHHGFRVLLIELDAGLRGLDLMLGLEDRNPYDMGDILKGRCDPYDAVSACGESRLSLLSAPSGDWSEFSQADLVWLCREIASYYDWILLDAPAGIGRGFRLGLEAADRALLVVTPDPICVRDAVAVSSIMERTRGSGFSQRLIINRVGRQPMGDSLPDLDAVIDQTAVQLIGVIPEDQLLARCAANGLALPSSARAFQPFDNTAWRLAGIYRPLDFP